MSVIPTVCEKKLMSVSENWKAGTTRQNLKQKSNETHQLIVAFKQTAGKKDVISKVHSGSLAALRK